MREKPAKCPKMTKVNRGWEGVLEDNGAPNHQDGGQEARESGSELPLTSYDSQDHLRELGRSRS